MMDDAAQGRHAAEILLLCQPRRVPPQGTYELPRDVWANTSLMHRNPECLKPPVSMTIKVQQFHEHGCLVHVLCRREVASLALGSRCLTRAVKSICHQEVYLIPVYRNPTAFPWANGSFCHGPGMYRGRAKTKERIWLKSAFLPSKGVTFRVRGLCRNSPPKCDLQKQLVASCRSKDLPALSCLSPVLLMLTSLSGWVTSLLSLPRGIHSSLWKRQEKTWLLALTVLRKK